MGKTNNKYKYLDIDGLKNYDKLIKNYINFINNSLADNVKSLSDDVTDIKTKGYVTENEVENLIKDTLIVVSNEEIDDLFK